MRDATREAVEACLVGLNTAYTPEEAERLSTPPYPLPDRLVPERDLVLAEVERLGREGQTAATSTCMSTLMQTHLQDWSAIAGRLSQAHGDRFFQTALMLVFTASDMSPSDFEAAIAQVPSGIARNQLRIQLIHVLLRRTEIDAAERVSEALEAFHGQDQRFYGHRHVARWHAEQGDAAGFFARWPRLAAGKDRDNMQFQKQALVQSVAHVHGWREALDVAADKRIGPRFRRSAFVPLAEAGELDRLLALFASAEATGVLDEVEELEVITGALVVHTRASGVATYHPFVEILERVVALDPSEKSVMRARDGMLLTLWPAYPDTQTLALARKSARAPRIRRELTVLHPAIARPAATPGERPT